MAVDMFLDLEGIPGESHDDKFKGKIDLLAWSWGMSQSGSTHMGGGGGSGKANFNDLSCTKWVDKASPLLMQYVSNGKHIPKATLTVRKAGEKPLDYLVYTFTDLIVSSVSTGGSGGEDRLTENLSLNFAKWELTYKPQKKDGSGDADVKAGWDIKENKTAV
jgi:type VI secretion system secreted protein Hcp